MTREEDDDEVEQSAVSGDRRGRVAGDGGVGAARAASRRPKSSLGMHTDLSGVAATYGVSSSNGVKMRFDEVNEAGGINGRKIKVIVEDQAYQVPKAVQACNKLINRDKVFAFVAPLGTPMNNACFKDQFAAGVPNLFPLSAARSMYEPLRAAEVLRRGLLRRPDPLGHRVLRQEEGQEGRLRDVPGHRLRQGDPGGRRACRPRSSASRSSRRRRTSRPTRTSPRRSPSCAAAGCDLIAMGTIVRDSIVPYTTARKAGWTDVDLPRLGRGLRPGRRRGAGHGRLLRAWASPRCPTSTARVPIGQGRSSRTTRRSSTSIPTSARSTATSPPTSPCRA